MPSELETIIGLEVHAQISTKTKMFCGCDNDAFGKEPNTVICPVCTGHPGTLPIPNKSAIEKAVRAALALKCAINAENHFDRKHYFYPDLPAGFQISQYDFPLGGKGTLEFEISNDAGDVTVTKSCGITRLHLENDAGKLSHSGKATLCDFNRAGTPLMEIVTEPDLGSSDEAVAFAQELRRILIAVGASEADMFKGMMRFDASISLREKGAKNLNPRSEIKNLNSFKSLEKALKYEEKRLRELWKKHGGPLKGNITVGWIEDEEKTRILREKETADDYRYFPEPDIPPIRFSAQYIKSLGKNMPALPREIKKHYIKLGLDESHAFLLADQERFRDIFDAVYVKTGDARRTAGIVLTQLLGFLNVAGKSASEGPDADCMLQLIEKIDEGAISANTGKQVLERMVATGKSASEIIEQLGIKQISDASQIEHLIHEAVLKNPKAVEAYKKGKEAAFGAIIGWIMKESKGQADPKKVSAILKKELEKL